MQSEIFNEEPWLLNDLKSNMAGKINQSVLTSSIIILGTSEFGNLKNKQETEIRFQIEE